MRMRKPRLRKTDENVLLYHFIDSMLGFCLFIIACVFIAFIAMTPLKVSDDSLSDVSEGDIVFVDKIGRWFFDYERGDIVAYKKSERGGGNREVGRIVAFGGESVLITDGSVYIDGCLLDETDYAGLFSEEVYESFTVVEGKLLILPDNRQNIDAVVSEMNTISYDAIIGEIRLRLYPFGELELFV